MLATCLYVSSRQRQFQLELSWCQHVINVMTEFMDGTRVGWCIITQPSIQIHAARAITLLSLPVIFRLRNGTSTYINGSYVIFVTCMHQHMPIQCNFLQDFAIFLYVQKNQLTCQLTTTCHVVWHGLDGRIWQCVGPKFPIFPWNVGMLVMIWFGGVR